MQEKDAVTREVSQRHKRAGKKEKTGILDELAAITKQNRKHLITKLGKSGKAAPNRETF